LVVLGLVVWRNKTNKKRVIWGGVVFFVFALLPYRLFIYQTPVEKTFALEQEAQRIEYKAKYEAAKPIFDKLCKDQSAPIIKRTVEDVEGVLLLKVRPKADHKDWANQMWAGAGLDASPTEHAYIKYFLYDRKWQTNGLGEKKWESLEIAQDIGGSGRRGLLFVDVTREGTGEVTRVTATVKERRPGFNSQEVTLIESKVVPPFARYAVTFEDNVEPELRKHWIAGSTIKVIDTTTSEVIAEQTYWNWDAGFGNTTGSRSPWNTSNRRCPSTPSKSDVAHKFVDQVLKTKRGN